MLQDALTRLFHIFMDQKTERQGGINPIRKTCQCKKGSTRADHLLLIDSIYGMLRQCKPFELLQNFWAAIYKQDDASVNLCNESGFVV